MKIAFSAISLIFSTAVTASPFVPKLTSRALPSLSYSAFISPLTSTSFPLPSSTSSSSSLSSSTTTNINMSPLPECPTIPLRDGTPHHAIGFGTYKVGYIPPSSSAAASATASNAPLRTATECIADALKVGYRFFECAEFYNNEAEVGKAIKESGIARENLFLCSKVWTTTIEKGEEAIRARLDQTLADLGTDYLDLYLIHWPVPTHHISAYKTLEKLKFEGKIHNIGVSNYVIEDYKELLDSGITVKPAVNQIEINPFLYRKNTIEYFRKQNVVLQSYRSLRDGKAMDHPTLKSIAESHGKTPAQILGRWCVQHGFVYIPKSVKLERMKENAEVFDFELTEKEMQELDNLTTPEALETFKTLYQKCVNRDTTKDGTMEGVKMDITID